MAVVLCTNTLSGRTGLHKSVAMTANHLHRAGHPVTLISFLGSGDGSSTMLSKWPLDLGLPAYSLRSLAAENGRLLHADFSPTLEGKIPKLKFSFTENNLAALRQLNAALGDEDHIIFTHPIQARAFQCAVGNVPRLVHTALQIHGDYKVRHPELVPLLEQVAPVIDHIQIVSRGMRESYDEMFGSHRVTWIPNIHEPLEMHPIPHAGVRVALAGSFQEAKNQLDAVRMLALIDDPSVELVLWGKSVGEYAGEVRRLVDDLNLQDRVSMPGTGSEREVYETTDIVVIPSLSEGFGYPLVEAASHGLPVVAYDYDYGPRDVIEDGTSGFIVPLGDTRSLARAVGRLSADADLRTRMGRAARKTFDEFFTPDRLVAAYATLIGPPSGAALDIPGMFTVSGPDPIGAGAVSATEVRRTATATWLRLTIRAQERLRGFRATTRRGSRGLRALRIGNRYEVILRVDAQRRNAAGRQTTSVTCEVTGRDGRFYVGHTNADGRFIMHPYLRRAGDDEVDASNPAVLTLHDNQLRVPRHPRYAAVSGVDNFGSGMNADHGVMLRNVGTAATPAFGVSGEWDRLEVHDGRSAQPVTPPMDYQELFERVCEAESQGGLFDIAVDGIHPWELHRGAFIAKACEAFGLWGPHFSAGGGVLDEYDGDKRLADSSGFRRVLFEFSRKPHGVDARTAAFQDDQTMIIEYPQEHGYSAELATAPNRFPIREYNAWRETADVTVPRVDPRPFEEALTAALGLRVVLTDRLEERVRKFAEELEFWSPVFDAIRPEEVVIPSSHWQAGVCEAARRAGAQVSDIQYALTSPLHPSFWFGEMPRHGATHLYAWSPMWAERTNAYASHSFVPKVLPAMGEEVAVVHDVLVISQPRVSRRILQFVEALAATRPDLRIGIAPHPDERSLIAAKVAGTALAGRVDVVTKPTIAATREAAVCVGGYSTSLYEAAYLGKPTYVLPVPGHELLRADIDSGLFRIATGPEVIEPYSLPSWRTRIFGG